MIQNPRDWIKSDKPIKYVWVAVLENFIAVLFPRLFCMIKKKRTQYFLSVNKYLPMGRASTPVEFDELYRILFPHGLVALYFAIISSSELY